MNKDTGGSAYPAKENNRTGYDYRPSSQGMTLRQWYAGMALTGMLAHSTRYKPREGCEDHWHDAIAVEALEIADAMIVHGSEP